MRVTFVWNANSEADIAGYKIYAGTASGTYNDANSPRDVGNVTSGYFDVNTFGAPMYFALTAYNTGAQESDFSTEVSQTFTRPVTLFKR
jgi:hypothetical protein